jgi:Domain of unknown function (DUF4263)
MGSLPAETTLDEIIVRIHKSYTNPNVRSVTQVVLRNGPVAFRIATLMELINPVTGEFHHYQLKIDQIDRRKQGWFYKPEKSVRLDGEEPNEIEKLYTFLSASLADKFKNETGGELHLIRGEDYAKLEGLLQALPNLADADKFQLVKNVLAQLDGADSTIKEFAAAFEGSSEQTLRHIAAASRLVQYKEALAELKRLVNDPTTTEPKFQKHLERNPWLFGSEYSELLERRAWSRDEQLDYMLRRTADNYLEIVEIKTAFAEPLFQYDDSRSLYYPSSRLSKVIGQVMKYIEEVERNRDHIRSKDKEDTLKIRARAILGRDHDADHQAALRNLNDHLHGIEILTFDQLIRIGERMMSIFEVPNQEAKEDFVDDIPF